MDLCHCLTQDAIFCDTPDQLYTKLQQDFTRVEFAARQCSDKALDWNYSEVPCLENQRKQHQPSVKENWVKPLTPYEQREVLGNSKLRLCMCTSHSIGLINNPDIPAKSLRVSQDGTSLQWLNHGEAC